MSEREPYSIDREVWGLDRYLSRLDWHAGISERHPPIRQALERAFAAGKESAAPESTSAAPCKGCDKADGTHRFGCSIGGARALAIPAARNADGTFQVAAPSGGERCEICGEAENDRHRLGAEHPFRPAKEDHDGCTADR